MPRIRLARCFLVLLAVRALSAHAPPTPIPTPPFHVQANRLVDAKGDAFLLRGSVLPVLDAAVPAPVALRTLQQRWNLNAVRLPASVTQWTRDGQAYLDRVAAAVATANRERLVVVLSAAGDTPAAAAFWSAAARQLQATPGVIFAIDSAPPASGWRDWQAAVQPLIDAIRAAGATQAIAVPGLPDVEFQGFGREFYPRDANLIYNVQTAALTDDVRDRNFGFLVNEVPVLVASWTAACSSITSDSALAALFYFDRKNLSWTLPTGACGTLDQNLLLWMTGDPGGFGSIDRTQTASAAGGFPGPIAPGEILSLYGQGIGPESPLGARLTAGRVDTALGEVQVFFDGVAAPVLLAGYFQVNVQVPYEVAGRGRTVVQLAYREVLSNQIELEVVPAAPEIFTTFPGAAEALVLNADGSLNSASNPAPRGSIIALFATGTGQTTPPAVTGVPAVAAPGSLAAALTIGGLPAEIAYAGPAPTLVGVAQINARVPAGLPEGPQRAALVLTVGVASRSGVVCWVR